MPENEIGKNNGRLPWWIGLLAFLAIILPFQWGEHKAHILGALPYLLLLACPLIHSFMHGSHGHGGEGHEHGRRTVSKGGTA